MKHVKNIIQYHVIYFFKITKYLKDMQQSVLYTLSVSVRNGLTRKDGKVICLLIWLKYCSQWRKNEHSGEQTFCFYAFKIGIAHHLTSTMSSSGLVLQRKTASLSSVATTFSRVSTKRGRPNSCESSSTAAFVSYKVKNNV